MEQKTWLITGASSGFGREWAKAALEAGHQVVATVRDFAAIGELKDKYGDKIWVTELDVRDRTRCFEVVQEAKKVFGGVDVMINNAGYGQFGYMEELTEEDVKLQMDVNVNGSIWMIQAVLPVMREQKSGHIIQVSSIGGLVSYPGIGMYHASKWAVEGICESLAQEVAHFNIHVTLVEPGGYATDFGKRSSRKAVEMAEYDFPRDERKKNYGKPSVGDPKATCQPILDLVANPNPPLRLLMGERPWSVLKPRYEERLKSWEENMDITIAAHGSND
jgi:NADP-dependent 3-hydroxy acid dehydrogenase YdfG